MSDSVKRINLPIKGIDEGKESQDNGFDLRVFNNIRAENFPKQRKDLHIRMQEVHRPPTVKIGKETTHDTSQLRH